MEEKGKGAECDAKEFSKLVLDCCSMLDNDGHDAGEVNLVAEQSEVAVELVEGSVGMQPQVVLSNSRSAKESGLAGVSGFGVDLHNGFLI
jgi:hypothetical protein